MTPFNFTAIGGNLACASIDGQQRAVETGGKDFLLAHPSADVPALSTALLHGAFEYQGQKCSAVSRAYVPASLRPAVKARLADDVATVRIGDVRDLGNFTGAVIDQQVDGAANRRHEVMPV